MTPVVDTERLTLRAFTEQDFATYAAWHADADTMKWVAGAPLSRADAWRNLAMIVGHWTLRGFGMWAVEEKSTRALVGRVGLWFPEGWPGVEVGWLIGPAHRRKGYALEAARASLEHGFRHLDVARIVSVIHVDNEPSKGVARALGERFLEHKEIRGSPCEVWGVDRPA